MKKQKQERGLFDDEMRLRKISKQGDPLERLNRLIDFEIFRPILEKIPTKVPKGPGGRPAYDVMLKFKMVILQRLYNISDEQLEYQVIDRLSFMRFLGLTLADDVPDCTTIWLFREQLKVCGLVQVLFNRFQQELERHGLIAHEGSIIDASFVEVPKQRNRRDDNEQIKKGEIPEAWQAEDTQAFRSQKDVDARWTKKNQQNYYGYKNHVKVDSKSKVITNYLVTDAAVHDSQVLKDLLEEDNRNKPLYADSAYTGQRETLAEWEIEDQINEKGYRNSPLTEEQKENNRVKSKIRARVEHVFGFIHTSMKGPFIRTIGKTG